MLQCEVNGYGIESEQLDVTTQCNPKIKEVPVSLRYDGLAKTSKKNSLKHGMVIINFIITLMVQRRPLWLLGVPGFFFIKIYEDTALVRVWRNCISFFYFLQ